MITDEKLHLIFFCFVLQYTRISTFYKVIFLLEGKQMAYVISNDCIACGACAEQCPVECISAGDIYVINADDCISCGSCAEQCPVNAISEA